MSARQVGLGCMRLSTAAERPDRSKAIEVIVAAIDAGATLLDTSDAYCLDDEERGHNEELVAEALRELGRRPRVATKGGLTRPRGAWVPDGRAKHLTAAAEASAQRLGAPIDLYFLHAVDPKTSLVTSARALAKLHKRGVVQRVGLSNVNVTQVVQAREWVEVSAVQVSLSRADDESVRGGLVEYCARNDITLVAHSPLGGPKVVGRWERDTPCGSVAQRHDATPHEVAVAYLCTLGSHIVPIVGATRLETARAIGRIKALELTAADIEELDAAFAAADLLRRPLQERRPAANAIGEVVLVMGCQAAGKTAVGKRFAAQGYARLNRDERGGSMQQLVGALRTTLAEGKREVVLDNTFPRRSTRNAVIEAAWDAGVPARCVWIKTELLDAQVNAISRLLDRYGELPTPEQLAEHSKSDPGAFGPNALHRYFRHLEPPLAEEGFESIDTVEFERSQSAGGRALVVPVEGVLCDDWRLHPGRAQKLTAAHREGWQLLGISWQPDVGRGRLEPEDLEASFATLAEQLRVPIEFAYCPHPPGPPVCWCRKPLPGLALAFFHRCEISAADSLVVGRSGPDKALATALGARYEPASAFFDSRVEF